MKDPIDLDLLGRYVAGESSPIEATRVHALAQGDPRIRALITAIASLRPVGSGRNLNTVANWSRISPPLIAHAHDRLVWFPLAVIVTLGVIAVLQFGRVDRDLPVGVGNRTFTAPPDLTRLIGLGDGSTITLEAGGSLDVRAADAGSGPVVHVRGKSSFRLANNLSRPYTIQAANTQVRVLSSAAAFEVSAHPNAPAVEVVVASGTVRLAHMVTRTARVLGPGQRGTLDRSGQFIGTTR